METVYVCGFFLAALCLSGSSWASLVVAPVFSWSAACEILVPQPGIEPISPALEDESLTA